MHCRAALLCALASLLGACHGTVAPDTHDATYVDAGPFVPGDCAITNGHKEPTSAFHVPQGTVVDYPTNPPCGGDHYPIWATWGAHSYPLPAGNWVHNLEHGGIVFLYKCANRAACPDLASKIEAIASSLPLDPECVSEGVSTPRRVLVLPDPDLPAGVLVASVAWGYYYTASCIEPLVMKSFFLAHDGKGSEQYCGEGAVGDFPPDTEAGSDGESEVEASADGAGDGEHDSDGASG